MTKITSNSAVFDGTAIPRPDASGDVIPNIVSYVFVLIGIIAVIMILVGAIKFVTAAGDSQKVAAARSTLLYSVIGVVISISAFSIIGFVLDRTDREVATSGSDVSADGDVVIFSAEEEVALLRGAQRALSPAPILPSVAETREDVAPEDDERRAVFYLDANGSDSGDGSQDQPVQSLQRINDLLEANPPDSDVRIIISPGTYYDQRVNWTYYSPNHFVRFEAEDINNRPVFDGCTQSGSCSGGTFFSARPGGGIRTNLDFWYLRVENYQVAIQLGGRRGPYNYRENEPHWDYSAGNRIYGMWFENIGEDDTAVVRLVNGRDNLIQNNHFINAISEANPARLHAVYMAHHSSNNAIRNNRFVNISGDAVRVRDESNFNSITGNIFESAGVYGYSDWFCDHIARIDPETGKSDCTKFNNDQGTECPSWGNEFRNNTLGSQYNSNEGMRMFRYYQEEDNTGDFVPNYPGSDACARPDATTPKLRTSSNERI